MPVPGCDARLLEKQGEEVARVGRRSTMSGDLERWIFLEAIEQEDLQKRAAYLDHACRGEPEIRKSVEALLAAHDEPDDLLDDMLVAGAHLDVDDFPTSGSDSDEALSTDHIGMQIGAYRLMEQIGEGGFGLVFVALQEHPVQRKVALKIVKPGMGSKEVIARFEAERQAVAMMDHPHIARIFDAGVTEDARPYFVMELVRGVPITEFCDRQRYAVSQRLKLYLDVCSAVQHAHQKGVIHRDLKPSNVMVTLHDGKPIVKVIDFGVAKAIGQNLTDKTIYTRFFSMIGTPLYMSPEQAELSSLDVDTRSDIYSLGVMLYELLVGTTPVDQGRLDSAGFDELRRIIREEEPPRPSARITTLGDRATTIADLRQIESARLGSILRGDLDWIVMKAIEKDRGRRYESAADLASDIRLYLNSEPIQARPPSTAYLMSKFARRNRATLLTGASLAATLCIATVVSLWQMLNAIDEKNKKDLALSKALIAESQARAAKDEIERFAEDLKSANLLIASGQVHADNARWYSADKEYSRAVEIQSSYYLPWVLRGQLYARLYLWEDAARDYEQALSLGAPTDEPHWWGVSALLKLVGRETAYEQLRASDLSLLTTDDSGPRWITLRSVLLEPEMNSVLANRLVRLCEDWQQRSPGPMRPGRDRTGVRNHGGPPMAAGYPAHAGPSIDAGHSVDTGPSIDVRYFDRRPMSGPRSENGQRQSREHPHSDQSQDPQQHGNLPEEPRFDRRFDKRRFDERSFAGPRPEGRPPEGPPLEGRPPHGQFGPGNRQDVPHHVQSFVVSLAYLRANAWEECVESLKRLEGDRGWPSRGEIHAPLAIAYFKSGNQEAALEALERSAQAIDAWLDRASQETENGNRLPWFDLAESLVLHREAEQAINGQVTERPGLDALYQSAAERIASD